MLDIDLDRDLDRATHPLDVMEHLATLNEWSFDRDDDDELSVIVVGSWAEYQVSATWLDQMEAIHLAASFDLKVPARRRAEVQTLISAINEQLWIGHFDLWNDEQTVMFRHSLLLSGGADPTSEQVAVLVRAAVESCERYFQAFQFVVWAGKSAREALEGALMETQGNA